MPSTGSTRSDESPPPLLCHTAIGRIGSPTARALPTAREQPSRAGGPDAPCATSASAYFHRVARGGEAAITSSVTLRSWAADTMGSRRCRQPTCGGPRRRRRPGRRYPSTPQATTEADTAPPHETRQCAVVTPDRPLASNGGLPSDREPAFSPNASSVCQAWIRQADDRTGF